MNKIYFVVLMATCLPLLIPVYAADATVNLVDDGTPTYTYQSILYTCDFTLPDDETLKYSYIYWEDDLSDRASTFSDLVLYYGPDSIYSTELTFEIASTYTVGCAVVVNKDIGEGDTRIEYSQIEKTVTISDTPVIIEADETYYETNQIYDFACNTEDDSFTYAEFEYHSETGSLESSSVKDVYANGVTGGYSAFDTNEFATAGNWEVSCYMYNDGDTPVYSAPETIIVETPVVNPIVVTITTTETDVDVNGNVLLECSLENVPEGYRADYFAFTFTNLDDSSIVKDPIINDSPGTAKSIIEVTSFADPGSWQVSCYFDEGSETYQPTIPVTIHVSISMIDSVDDDGTDSVITPTYSVTFNPTTAVVGSNVEYSCDYTLNSGDYVSYLYFVYESPDGSLTVLVDTSLDIPLSFSGNDVFSQIGDYTFYCMIEANDGDYTLGVIEDAGGGTIRTPITLSIYETADDIPGDDVEETTETKKKSNGGCADCIPPTIGLDTNYNRVVENGFSYNNNPVNVVRWHTPFPLINATVGETNSVEIIVYENGGTHNMKRVQFGLGGQELGQPLSTFEVIIEVPLFKNYTSGYMETDELTITDKDNLIENSSVTATSNIISCGATTSSCLKITLQYSYREATLNNMMVVNVVDKPGNSQNFYFNHGIAVLGDSVNISPTIILFEKHLNQQTTDLWVNYTRTDKVKDIWIDQNGIEYKRINDNWFDRITPLPDHTCNDPLLNQTMNGGDRNNCHFRALTPLWDY